jgi:hypothetical protein
MHSRVSTEHSLSALVPTYRNQRLMSNSLSEPKLAYFHHLLPQLTCDKQML